MKRIDFRICLMLCLCFAVLLSGCALMQKPEGDDASKPEAPVAEGSLDADGNPIATPTPTPLEQLYYDYSDYTNVLQDTCTRFEETMGSDYLIYAVYDLDGDGILELLVMEGTCEADFIWQVYTMSESGAKQVGAFGGSHSGLYLDEEPGILCQHGQMGVEEIERITYDGEYLSSTLILDVQHPDGEDYTTPGTPVPTARIDDPSLIPTL